MTSISWKDTSLVLIVSLALCGESLLLLHQMRIVDLPWSLGRPRAQGRIAGQVLQKENEVRNRAEGSLTWYPTGVGDSLRLEDTLLTGPDGHVRVALEPEGELVLGPNSMIRFSQTRQAGDLPVLSLEVRRGAAEVASRSRGLSVQVQSRELALDASSEIRVTASELVEEARVEVKSGAVREAAEETRFQAGEAMEIKADGQVAQAVLPLQLTPASPAEGEVLTTEGAVQLAWNGDEASQVEVSFSPNFDPSNTHPAQNRSAALTLSPGVYYWRLREGERTSEPATFIVRPPVRISAESPADKQVLKGGDGITLSWSKVSVAAGYYVQVGQDPGFTAVLFEKRIGTNRLKLPSLKRGDYVWRVRAEHPQFGNWPFTEGFSFTVKDRLAPPKTKGVKVLKKKSEAPRNIWEKAKEWLASVERWILPVAVAAEPTVRLYFEWKEVEGAAQYQFELSRSSKFEHIQRREKTPQTQISVEVNVNTDYYWRVRGIDEEGGLGAPSAPQKIRPRRLLEIYQASGGEDSEDGIKLDKTPNFYSVAVGPSGGYHFQNINGSNGLTENRGIPLNRGEFKLLAGNLTRPWEARVWYQARRYSIANSELGGTQTDLRHDLYGGQILWHSPWRVGLPLRFGVQAEYVPVLRRTGVVTTVLERRLYYGVVFGGTLSRLLGERWRVTGDMFLEGTPLGELKGIGAILRGRVAHSGLSLSALGMVAGPELELGFYPSYRWATPDNRTVFTMDFSLTLYLSIQFLG